MGTPKKVQMEAPVSLRGGDKIVNMNKNQMVLGEGEQILGQGVVVTPVCQLKATSWKMVLWRSTLQEHQA